MGDTNFMSYDNAQSVLGEFANAIKGKDDPYITITYSDWLELTDQEKETGKYYITGAPGADGSIQVDLMTKLWENPDTTQGFAEQDIPVSIAGYKFILIIAGFSVSDMRQQSFMGTVGNNVNISFGIPSSSGSMTCSRFVDISNTSKITFYNATTTAGTDAPQQNNNRCIPIAIYGIHATQNIHLNAIASDVSTSADKCMLSDEKTSVEDVLNRFSGNIFKHTIPAGSFLTFKSENGSTYISCLILCMIQNQGPKILGITSSPTYVSVKDIINGADWSLSSIPITASSNGITISNNSAYDLNVLIIRR